jgi:biopolymer transport protein ExbB
VTTTAGALPHDMSPWGMFMAADVVVKAVMLSLAFASLATWTVFVGKSLQLFLARRRLRIALARIGHVTNLEAAHLALGSTRSVLTPLSEAALNELRLSAAFPDDGGIEKRAATQFLEIARNESRSIRMGTGILATIGATAPFVGLFGTVWGIMNSFIGISKSQTTNLAIVAPGIAEALLATAIGLVAAIPAVIIYNHFARQTRSYLDMVRRASGAIATLLSRDLSRRSAAPHAGLFVVRSAE